ncbi:MAG TPA: DUF4384 domain-containing protein [Stellaceae bacterium]|nr:DUF4384 domain-containing protein [Stellaceae bacterium]
MLSRACRQPLLALALGAGLLGCTAAYKTDMLRKDVLTDAQAAIAATQINHGDMTMEVSADRPDTTYDPGQPITLSVKVSKDAHVAILRVLPNGDTAIVFPNRAHPGSDIAAGQVLSVPAADDAVKLAADKPGIVLFEFVASTAGDSWLFKRAPAEGADFAELGVTTHALARDIVGALKVGRGPDTVARYLTVRIAGRSLF